jgi:hypothetical protein
MYFVKFGNVIVLFALEFRTPGMAQEYATALPRSQIVTWQRRRAPRVRLKRLPRRSIAAE